MLKSREEPNEAYVPETTVLPGRRFNQRVTFVAKHVRPKVTIICNHP